MGGGKTVSEHQQHSFAHHTACTDAAQSSRECKTDGRRSGISCKDQTLFFSLVTLVGKCIKYLEDTPTFAIVYEWLLAWKCKHLRARTLSSSHYIIAHHGDAWCRRAGCISFASLMFLLDISFEKIRRTGAHEIKPATRQSQRLAQAKL